MNQWRCASSSAGTHATLAKAGRQAQRTSNNGLHAHETPLLALSPMWPRALYARPKCGRGKAEGLLLRPAKDEKAVPQRLPNAHNPVPIT